MCMTEVIWLCDIGISAGKLQSHMNRSFADGVSTFELDLWSRPERFTKVQLQPPKYDAIPTKQS